MKSQPASQPATRWGWIMWAEQMKERPQVLLLPRYWHFATATIHPSVQPHSSVAIAQYAVHLFELQRKAELCQPRATASTHSMVDWIGLAPRSEVRMCIKLTITRGVQSQGNEVVVIFCSPAAAASGWVHGSRMTRPIHNEHTLLALTHPPTHYMHNIIRSYLHFEYLPAAL